MAIMNEKELQEEFLKKEAKKLLTKKIKEKLMPVVFWILAGIFLLIFSSVLFAGRIGWEYALVKYNEDGSYSFRKSIHYTMEGCEATRSLYWNTPLYKCIKIR